MIPPENLTRWQEITAKLEELSKLDILDFWEEVQKLEREKANLFDPKPAPVLIPTTHLTGGIAFGLGSLLNPKLDAA